MKAPSSVHGGDASVCGQPITMFLGDSDHEFVKKQLKDEGWGHKDCVE